MNFSAVILAGGRSSRMGRDKAWLEIGGQPLLVRQIQVARELGAAEVFISGRMDADYAALGCRVLRDKFAGAGPLAGIERALDAATLPLLLVLAVDLPRIRLEFLRGLAAGCAGTLGAIPRVNGAIEPLAAFYPKNAHSPAEALLGNGRNSASAFAAECVRSGLARFVELPAVEARHFVNWNTPADLPCLT
jgi:molybdopterin-guanine dinucleotide biosynthesis protein A